MIGKTTLVLALAGTALAMSPAHATSIAVSGGDGAVGIHADTALLPTLGANADYLRSDRGDAKLYAAGLTISPPSPLLHWTVGARYRYQDTRWGNGGGVELGASLFVDTPLPLVSVGGYGYYMPAALAHGKVQQIHDYGAQVRLSFTRAIYAWAGYRNMGVTFAGAGSHTLYQGPALGLSVGF